MIILVRARGRVSNVGMEARRSHRASQAVPCFAYGSRLLMSLELLVQLDLGSRLWFVWVCGLTKWPFSLPGLNDRLRGIPASVHIHSFVRPRALCLRVAMLGTLAQRESFWNPADDSMWKWQLPRWCRRFRSGLHAAGTMGLRPLAGSLGPSPSLGLALTMGAWRSLKPCFLSAAPGASGPCLRRLRCKSVWFPRITAFATFSSPSPTHNCEQQLNQRSLISGDLVRTCTWQTPNRCLLPRDSTTRLLRTAYFPLQPYCSA